MSDIIDDLIQRITRHLPEAAAKLPAIEAEARQQWGGTDRGYVRKGLAARTPAAKTQRLAEALQTGTPLAEAFVTAGMSRATGFRHLARPARPGRGR